MWQSTKELREKGNIDGTLIWDILEHHYPGNKEKQTRFLGFMNDFLTEQKKRRPKGVSSDVMWELTRKWNVERAVVTEALRHFPGTQQYLAATGQYSEDGESLAMAFPKETAYKVFRVSDGKLMFAGNKKDALREFHKLGGTKAGYRFILTRSETMPKITYQAATGAIDGFKLADAATCPYCKRGMARGEWVTRWTYDRGPKEIRGHAVHIDCYRALDRKYPEEPQSVQYSTTESLPLTYEEKRHKTLAAFLEMGEWYVRHQRPMPIKEMRAIGTKYFGTGDDYTEFLEYLRSPEGLKEFRHELRQIMRDHRISIPPEEEWLPLTELHSTTGGKWVTVISRGHTVLNINDPVTKEEFDRENERVRKLGQSPATGEIWEEGKPRRLPQTKVVTVTCPACGKVIEVPGYDKVTRSEALKRHMEKEHPLGHGQYPQTMPGGEPIPPEYRDLIGFISEPLPEYSLAVLPAIEVAEGERKIDVVLRHLKDGVENIQDSSRFRLFLTTMAKFHDYSIGNLILIAIQKPGATHVAGFVTWKDLGRWVRGGERGIAILAPVMPPKPKKEELEAEEEEIELAPVYFKVVHVFDISQTEGKPLPEFEVPVLSGEANEALFIKVMALAKSQGLDVSFEPRPLQDPAIKGQYFGKSIWVRPEEPRAQQLKSLIHELAHYYSEGVFRIARRDAETIAESAAFTVGAHYGFDSGVRSFPYVALWAQDKKVLEQNLGSVRKVATVILESLEKAQGGEKLLPALKPFDPYKFAEYVLRANAFSLYEIPIYSGLTGTNPLRVPDHIWKEALESIDGEFVKQGDLYIVKTPGVERPPDMRAAPTWREVGTLMSTEPTGTCYEDAWRFLIREEEGELIHGSVQTIGKRINHAWVELPSFVWEPKSGESMKKDYFYEIAEPQEQARYTAEEAAIMAARTGNLGPWTEQERKQYLKGESPAVISTEPSPPSLKEELEFVSDSPEYLAYTIEDIGYREKLDTAFETAIARAKGG